MCLEKMEKKIMLTDSKLDFFIKNNYNVLFIGKKGCGKSTVVMDAFERNKLKWKYFSASTMDPWVDFIGVPKEKTEKGKTYLELIRPKDFQDDEVEALFFDEFNRSHKKIRNAVMELIQFKSINGKKYNNLRFVWAAINPDDDESENYDVEKLDPAQKDRFHVHVTMPYTPNYDYFKNKYGVDDANSAIAWWRELPNDMKDLVSPRRLDYALDVYKNNGDISDVLDNKTNVSKLKRVLKNGPAKLHLKKLYDAGDIVGGESFLVDENNFADCFEYIMKDKDMMRFFVPLMTKEKISSLVGNNPLDKKVSPLISFLAEQYHKNPKIKSVYDSVIATNGNYKVKDAMMKMLPPTTISVNGKNIANTFVNETIRINTLPDYNTQDRKRRLMELRNNLPKKYSIIEEPLAALDVCSKILDRTQAGTIQNGRMCAGWGKQKVTIMDVINNCLAAINRFDNLDFNGMCRKYPIVANINSRLTRTRSSQLLNITFPGFVPNGSGGGIGGVVPAVASGLPF